MARSSDVERVDKGPAALEVEKIHTNDVLTEEEKKLVKRAT